MKNYGFIFMAMFFHVLISMENNDRVGIVYFSSVLPIKDYFLYSSVASAQGRKSTQEDLVIIKEFVNKDFDTIAAVYDGNGGIGLKNVVNLSKLIDDRIKVVTLSENVNDTIASIFQDANNQLKDVKILNKAGYAVNPWQSAGSTALLLFICKEKFYLAWAGDSEAIWQQNNKMQTIKSHHLTERAGQYSFYRSFGNFVANDPEKSNFTQKTDKKMTCEPDIVKIELAKTTWILMATDGLWAYTEKEEVFILINRLLKLDKESQDIVKKVLLLSILNDAQHNLIEKWFQFFFKEYARIIYLELRYENVKKLSYINNLKKLINTFYDFRSSVHFVINDLPFISTIDQLQIKKYNYIGKSEMLEALKMPEQIFLLKEDIQKETEEKLITKENFQESLRNILVYLYSHLDDGTLSEHLQQVFALNLEEIEIKEDTPNANFFYWELAFLRDMKNSFQQTVEVITTIKQDKLLYWHSDYLNKIINDIQCFANDNTAIVFLNILNMDSQDQQAPIPSENVQKLEPVSILSEVDIKNESEKSVNVSILGSNTPLSPTGQSVMSDEPSDIEPFSITSFFKNLFNNIIDIFTSIPHFFYNLFN